MIKILIKTGYTNTKEDQEQKNLSDGSITSENLKTLPKEVCGICGKSLDWSDKSKIHLDHIKPLIKGGLNSINNVQWTHAKCNLSKGSQ